MNMSWEKTRGVEAPKGALSSPSVWPLDMTSVAGVGTSLF